MRQPGAWPEAGQKSQHWVVGVAARPGRHKLETAHPQQGDSTFPGELPPKKRRMSWSGAACLGHPQSSHRWQRQRVAWAAWAWCRLPPQEGTQSTALGSMKSSCQDAVVLSVAAADTVRARHCAQAARATTGTWRKVAQQPPWFLQRLAEQGRHPRTRHAQHRRGSGPASGVSAIEAAVHKVAANSTDRRRGSGRLGTPWVQLPPRCQSNGVALRNERPILQPAMLHQTGTQKHRTDPASPATRRLSKLWRGASAGPGLSASPTRTPSSP